MSARQSIALAQASEVVDSASKGKIFNRKGAQSQVEKEFIAQFVLDQPREITQQQITALAKATRRPIATIREWIEDAKEVFAENARFYVDVHRNAVATAAASESMAGQDIAIKGAQWAIEHMGVGGARIVEKEAKGPTGTRIQIGVKVGGQNQPAIGIEVQE